MFWNCTWWLVSLTMKPKISACILETYLWELSRLVFLMFLLTISIFGGEITSRNTKLSQIKILYAFFVILNSIWQSISCNLMSDLPISNSCFQIKYLWNILLENWKAFHFHKVYSKESFLTVTSFVVSPMVFCETVQKFFTVCRKYCFHINCCKWISKVTNFRRSRSQIFFKIDFSF